MSSFFTEAIGEGLEEIERRNPYARDFQKDPLTYAEIEQITFAFHKLHSPRVVVSSVVLDLASRFKMPIGIIRSVVNSVAIVDQENAQKELVETLRSLLSTPAACVNDEEVVENVRRREAARKVLEKYQ